MNFGKAFDLVYQLILFFDISYDIVFCLISYSEKFVTTSKNVIEGALKSS